MKNMKTKILYIIIGTLIGSSLSTIYFKADAISDIYKNQIESSDNSGKEQDKNDNTNGSSDCDKNKEETTNDNSDNPNLTEDEKKDNSNGTSSNNDENLDNDNTDKFEKTYIVQAGDTLTMISMLYNTTVEQLKYANGLTSDMIDIGQELKIPNYKVISKPSDLLVLVNKKNNLPSNYVPSDLVIPNVPFPFQEYHEKKLMRKDAASALEELFKKAREENINIYAMSGYRSYDTQNSIFTSNVNKYGFENANQFSAKPGQSEHQTGLAMDITSPSVNLGLVQYFGETNEGKWLKDNAAEFGFIIRYPKGKEDITEYQYEPWHVRYVGKDIAKEISNENITLEEYLDEI